MMLFVAAIAGYALGSLPTAIWVGRVLHGVDIREHGSRNPGATNVFRVLGPTAGALVLTGDVLKGWIAVRLAFLLVGDPGDGLIPVVAGLAAIFGHTFSVFMRFDGGKGVATAAGVLLALMPLQIIGLLLAVWLVIFLGTRYVSLASLVVAAAFPVIVLAFDQPPSFVALSVLAMAVVFFRHRGNIARLLHGTELRFNWRRDG